MKRIFCCFAVLSLSIWIAVSSAETTVAQIDFSARNMDLNPVANTLMKQNEDRTYQVVDADGNVLSASYADMSVRSGFYRVTNESGVNTQGLLDGQGQVIIPLEYGSIEIISDRWQAGIVLKNSTAENYDYKSWSGDGFYLIDRVDLYYRGTKKGSLTRMDWNSADAYGDYLRVQNRERNYTFYNRDMQPSSREADGSSEYDDEYRTKTVWHQGSGQQAFTSSCTLTKDEVEQYYWEANGRVLDLQGNTVGDVANFASVYSPKGDYIRVRNGANLYGLVDYTGKVILPCAYESMESDVEGAAMTGYLYVEKDGKGGYVNLATGKEAGFEYSKDAIRYSYACFAKVNDLDGSTILISAAVGKLPTKYKDMRAHYVDRNVSNQLVAVEDMEGHAGVLGLMGEEIIPLDGSYDDVYDFTISNDGSLILASKEWGSYTVYRVNYDPDLSAYSATSNSSDDATWTCPNGHSGNTGKFCSECAAPRPENNGTWTCSNGHGGNTGKFCPKCGEPRP